MSAVEFGARFCQVFFVEHMHGSVYRPLVFDLPGDVNLIHAVLVWNRIQVVCGIYAYYLGNRLRAFVVVSNIAFRSIGLEIVS